MADDHARIVQLEAQVAALLDAQRHPRRRLPRRFLPLALVALLVVLTPLSLLAASPFNDLTGGVHDANIGLIYDAGITTGCVPNVSYCPTANVTREEMASFLARTAGLGTNPPVANAKTVQGYAPDGLVRVARAGAPSGTAIGVTTNFATVPPGTPEPASSYQVVLGLPIVAPTAGFLQVTGTVGAQRVGGAGDVALFARLRLVGDTAGTAASPRQISYVGVNGNPISSMTLTWVFPVEAGTQVVVLDAARYAVGTGAVNAFGPMLTATFVPFGSSGGSALSEGQVAPSVPGGPQTGAP